MKKNFLRIVGVVLLVLFSQSSAFAIIYGKGGFESEGYSEATAWEIDSAAVLAKVRDDVNSGKVNYEAYYKLTKDIDLTDYQNWSPIGATACGEYEAPIHMITFKGHFNGDGHTIKVNIDKLITDRNEHYHGLFGIIFGGSIKNLKVTGNVNYYTRGEVSRFRVGGIAAYLARGSIENCTFNGNVTAMNQGNYSHITYAGGITAYAGYQSISIKNCKVGNLSDTKITASTRSSECYAGGIVGYLHDEGSDEVSGNYSRVTLTSNKYTGGIYAARLGGGIVKNNTEADPSDPPPDSETLIIKTTSLPSGTVGSSYSTKLSAAGPNTPITWSATGLPDGLSCSKAGKISGKPTEAGTFKVKVKAKDSEKTVSKTLTLTVKAVKPTITTGATLSNGALKKAYSVTLKASGTQTITWTKSSGTLPTGLKLSKAGKISGTPTEAGTFKFKLKASNSAGSASRTFSITITKPTFSGTFKNGTLKKKYSSTIKVTGGTASYTWTKLSDTLPNGLKLTFSGAKATLSGTPTKTGTFKFKLKVTDKNKAAVSKTFTVKITKATSSSSSASSNETAFPSEQTNLPAGTQSGSTELFDGQNTNVNLYAELKVVSDDIVEAYEGKDSDLVKVKAGTPLRFEIGGWGTEVDNIVVYVDDKPLVDVEVSGEGQFTLPAEIVRDDFKIGVKAQSTTGSRESEELYIIAE